MGEAIPLRVSNLRAKACKDGWEAARLVLEDGSRRSQAVEALKPDGAEALVRRAVLKAVDRLASRYVRPRSCAGRQADCYELSTGALCLERH
jgi:hypothetical protein